MPAKIFIILRYIQRGLLSLRHLLSTEVHRFEPARRIPVRAVFSYVWTALGLSDRNIGYRISVLANCWTKLQGVSQYTGSLLDPVTRFAVVGIGPSVRVMDYLLPKPINSTSLGAPGQEYILHAYSDVVPVHFFPLLLLFRFPKDGKLSDPIMFCTSGTVSI